MVARTREARFLPHQPKDGDVVLVCPHFNRRGLCMHWHMLNVQADGSPGMRQARRPDGSTVESKWLCCCEGCLMIEPLERCIAGDVVWGSNEPIIREATN